MWVQEPTVNYNWDLRRFVEWCIQQEEEMENPTVEITAGPGGPCDKCEELFEELQWQEGDLPSHIDCPKCGGRTDLNVVSFDPSDPDFEDKVVEFMMDQAGEVASEADVLEFRRIAKGMAELDDEHRGKTGGLM